MSILGNPYIRGGGLGAAFVEGAKGILKGQDDQREIDWNNEKRAQLRDAWNREGQERKIMSTATPGATDEERLDVLIDIAERGERGDLAQKLKASKQAIAEERVSRGTASGAKAIMMGQFDQAVQSLNDAGIWGKISRIEPRDDQTVTISYTGEDGQEQPLDVPISAIAAASSDPKSFVKNVMDQQKLMQQGSLKREEMGVKGTQFEKTLEERERHNRAVELNQQIRTALAKQRASGGGSGGGKLTDYDKKIRDRMAVNGGDLAEAIEYFYGNAAKNRDLRAILAIAQGYTTPEDMRAAETQIVPPRKTAPAPPKPATSSVQDGARKQFRDAKTKQIVWFVRKNGAWVKE